MNKIRTLVLTLGGVLLVGAGYLVFASGGHDAAIDPLSTDWNSPDESHLADGAMAQADGTGPMRAELAGGDAASETAEDDGDEPPGRIAMSGRVLSDAGPPIAGARVAVTYRRNLGVGGGRGNFGRGGGNPEDFRQAFRTRPVAEPSITDSEGRFRIAGQAFGESSLEIEVTHREYAPSIVRRDWRSAEGAIQVDDVVLGAGVTVTGFVLDSNGSPLAAAAVQYSESGRGGFGRGGRGGFGGGGGGGRGGSRLEELVGGTKTNEAGFFQLAHVPPGEFRVRASAPKHLDANSHPLAAKSGERADAGELRLVIGVELRGIVLDAAGAPVVDARIEAGASREAMQAAFLAVREEGVDPMEVARQFMGIERRARTDKKGEFVLDSLPPAPLRLTVEHPRFVRGEREPIDPTKESRVVVQMQPALAVAGRVIDEQTGQALERFAIAVRPLDNNDGGFGGFGGRGGRGGDGAGGRRGRGGEATAPNAAVAPPRAVAPADASAPANASAGGQQAGRGRRGAGRGEPQDPAAVAARDAQRAAQDAQRDAREAYLRDRLGPTGRIPRDPGRPAAHPGGRFEVGGLQPGRYSIDVSAPDHVMMAAGPVELVVGQGATEVTIPLRKGARVNGHVENSVTHTPVANARVELLLPELEAAPTPNPDNPFANFRRGGEGGRQRLQQVRTDAQGKFTFKPVRGGAYWLRIEADGFNELVERSLFVTDGRDTDDFPFAIVPASEVHGVVRNGTPGTRYTVAFLSSTGQRVTARTDAEHRYRIESIEAGSYWVTLETGDGGRGMAGMGNRVAGLLRGETRPDVIVTEGSKVQHDLDALAESPGVVQGSVALNGTPGTGYEVSLTPVQPEAAPGSPDNGMGRMLGRFMGRGLTARTDAEGNFEIAKVPSGSYELEVRRSGGGGGGGGRGGRGGGGGSSIHSEPIHVTAGGTIIRRVVLSTGALALSLDQEADGKPVTRAAASLVLRVEADGKAPETWRNLPSFRNAQIREGKAEVRDLKVGEWQLRIQGQGIATVESTVFVQQSTEPTALKLKAKAGETAPGAGAGRGQGR